MSDWSAQMRAEIISRKHETRWKKDEPEVAPLKWEGTRDATDSIPKHVIKSVNETQTCVCVGVCLCGCVYLAPCGDQMYQNNEHMNV